MSLGHEIISVELVVFNYYTEKPQKVILGKMADNIPLATLVKTTTMANYSKMIKDSWTL